MSEYEGQFKERIEDYLASSTHLAKRHVHPRLLKMFEMGGIKAVFERAEGQYVWDTDGNRFLDLLAGGGVYFMGRNQPKINEALIDVLQMSLPNMSVVNASVLGGELAGQLLDMAGGDFGKVVFANSGSESNEVAIRFARVSTGRRRFLYLEGAFHGRSFGAASMCGYESMREGMEPLMPTCTPLKPNDIRQLRRELKRGDVAGVFIEPVQGMTGKALDAAYMREAETLCEQYGSLLIVDEVQTGLGRTGHWFASTGMGIRPHIMTTSKALSGGQIPVAAVLIRDSVYEAIYSKFGTGLVYFSTFAENNLAMTAALTCLEFLQEIDAPAQAAAKGQQIRDGLLALKEKYDVIDSVEGKGLMITVYFKDSAKPALLAQQKVMGAVDSSAFAAAVHTQLFVKSRIIAQLPGPGKNAIKVLPPVVITEDDIQYFLSSFEEVLADLYDPASGPVASLANGLLKDTMGRASKVVPALQGMLPSAKQAVREPTLVSGLLRLAMAAAIVGSAVMAGVWRRSPLAILPLAVGFTGAYVGGKLPQWRRSWQTHGFRSLLGLPITWLIQCVVVAVFYLVGLGFGTLFGERLWQPFGLFDVLLGVAVGLLGLVIGPVLDRLEGVGLAED